MKSIKFWFGSLFLVWMSTIGAIAQETIESSFPLTVGGRTIHVFRAPLGMFSPEERRDAAKQRIEAAFALAGDGWTSVSSRDTGFQIELDGKPLFMVLPGDVDVLAGETPELQANQASMTLQNVWLEAWERSYA